MPFFVNLLNIIIINLHEAVTTKNGGGGQRFFPICPTSSCDGHEIFPGQNGIPKT